MIPEIGHMALILALCLGVALGVLPLLGTYTGHARLIMSARPLAIGQGLFLTLSFVCLALAFVNDDFTVQYVAANSNSALPVQYKISAVWGSHEGSLLLWVLMLGWWTMAVSLFAKSIPPAMLARVLSVMGLIAIGFMLFYLDHF